MEIIRNNSPGRKEQFENIAASPQSKSQRLPFEHRNAVLTGAERTNRRHFDDGARQPVLELSLSGGRVVTNIKPAVRDSHRVNIFLDGKFSFSLDLAQLADYKLKVGQTLSEAELNELISASNFGKLYQRTLEYVFSRPHSIKETRDHLKRKQHTRQLQARRYEEFQAKLKTDPDFRNFVKESRTTRRHQVDFTENNENEYGAKNTRQYPKKPAAPISDQDIAKVLERLISRGYLDDANFARYYVENRNTSKGISTKKLRLELRQKGIADSLIDQALAASPRDQEQEIQKIITKKRRRGYDDQKLIQYLLRQGFDYELVRSSVLSETD